MIKLYGFGPGFGMPDPSPFVGKVDAYLRMAKLDYKLIQDMANLQKAPKGKLPFVKVDNEVISDSQFIFNHLDGKYNQPLDSWLTKEQQGWSLLAIKSLDENLYWCLVYSRWIEDSGWAVTKQSFFSALPPVVRNIVPIIARRGVRKSINGHGLGLHSNEEVETIAKQSLQALSDALADKPYFMGDKVSNLDAAAFALLSQFVLSTNRSSIVDLALKHDNLVQYCKRIAEQYYPGEIEI